jgi:hypothetical protein
MAQRQRLQSYLLRLADGRPSRLRIAFSRLEADNAFRGRVPYPMDQKVGTVHPTSFGISSFTNRNNRVLRSQDLDLRVDASHFHFHRMNDRFIRSVQSERRPFSAPRSCPTAPR